MTISNRISLDELRRMAIGDIAALPAEQLALLQNEADEALHRVKTACDWLAGTVALKYADRAHAARQARRQGHRHGPLRRRRDQGARAQVRSLAEPHPLRLRGRAHRPHRQAQLPSFPEHRGDVMSITKKLTVLREQHYGLEKLPETIRVPAIADRRDETVKPVGTASIDDLVD